MPVQFMNQILTMAGSDSGGGAGIQADLKTITMLGAYGASVITAVTAQNTLGVKGVYDIPLEGIENQIDTVCQDFQFSAMKTGMLSKKEVVELITRKIIQYDLPNVVVDPVMVATSGDLLLQEDAVASVRDHLLPVATLITPNLQEAEVLSGEKIETLDDMKRVGSRLIQELGCKNVLMKGGHLSKMQATDLLCMQDGSYVTFPGKGIDTKNTHGTGCTLSAALAVFLGKGMDLPDAVKHAKDYLTKALYYAKEDRLGHGSGPVRHNYVLDPSYSE